MNRISFWTSTSSCDSIIFQLKPWKFLRTLSFKYGQIFRHNYISSCNLLNTLLTFIFDAMTTRAHTLFIQKKCDFRSSQKKKTTCLVYDKKYTRVKYMYEACPESKVSKLTKIENPFILQFYFYKVLTLSHFSTWPGHLDRCIFALGLHMPAS